MKILLKILKAEICRKYNVAKSTVSKTVKSFGSRDCYKTNHRGGRPRKISQRLDRIIVKELKKDPFLSSTKLTEKLELQISNRTVRRRANDAKLFSRIPAKKSLTSFKNRKLTLAFAEAHQNWTVDQWKNILFSDESKYNLFGSDGKKRVWRPKNTRFNTKYTKKSVKHGTSAMVWGCFLALGTGLIHKVNGIMDRFVYKDIMEDVMLPHTEWEMPLKWIFQQDNDPKHKSKVVKQWFKDKNITIMEWPAQSPDLNPIENLWEIIDNKIERANVKTSEELFEQINKAWREIDMRIVDSLIESMPRRMKAVIKSKGGPTKY